MNIAEGERQGAVSRYRPRSRGGDLPAGLLKNRNQLEAAGAQRLNREDTHILAA